MAVNAPVERPQRIDPRVARTRKLLRDALASLLAEKNFESISVLDIAERATVNRATFYAHFTDKFALLDAMIRENFAAHLSEGSPLAAPETGALLTKVGERTFAFVALHRRCRIDPDFEPQMQRSLEAELTDLLSPRFGHCTAMLIASALVGAAMNWRHQSPNAPPRPVVENIVRILVDGVGR